MQILHNNLDNDCARLHDYLDGKLSTAEQFAFDSHAAECEDCRIEIELHHEIGRIPDDIVLPKDFSKVVAATAESQVTGLRKRKERTITFTIIAGLAMLLFVVLGANFQTSVDLVVFAVEKIGSVLFVIGSFVYNLLFGIVVIAKVAATQFDISYAKVVGVFGVGLGILLVYLMFTGRLPSLRVIKR